MSNSKNVEVKNDSITIQLKLNLEEYSDIQQAKIAQGKARESNTSYYKELMLKGLQKSKV